VVAVLKIAVLYNVPTACKRLTTDLIIFSRTFRLYNVGILNESHHKVNNSLVNQSMGNHIVRQKTVVDKASVRFYAAGVVAFLFSLPAIGFLFGMVIHESGHAIACLFFGLPYSLSWTQVVYATNQDPLINTIIGLAGGGSQALFSLLFFGCTTLFEKRLLFRSIFEMRRSPKLSAVFGFEAAFLMVGFHGIANGIWEGLLYQHYSQNYSNPVLTGVLLLASFIFSMYIVYTRFKRLTMYRSI